MASKAGKCSICTRSLGKSHKPEVTTSCKHTFHSECAERLIKEKTNDCPVCYNKSALAQALRGNRTATNKQSDYSASKTTTNNENTSRVALATMNKSYSSNVNAKDTNENEWKCSNCSMKNPASARRCESCKQSKTSTSSVVNSTTASAFQESYHQTSPADKNQQSHRHHYPDVVKKNNYDDYTSSNRQRWNRQDNTEWTCDQCDYDNRGSDAICKNCKQGKTYENDNGPAVQQLKRPLPPIHDSLASPSSFYNSTPKKYSEFDYDSHALSHLANDRQPVSKISSTSLESAYDFNAKSKSSKEKTQPSTSSTSKSAQYQVPVYISGLPLDTEDDHELASHIRHRIEKTLNIEAGNIKCYSKLGVGVMYVSSNEKRDHLINEVGTFALHPKQTQNLITFVDKPQLVSYIVLDVSKEKTDFIPPTAEEISRRWRELNNGEKPLDCDQLNIQFPNIYRLVSTSLDQLVSSLNHQDFKIKNQFARIFFCADCSFLEDLPRSITRDQLQSAIIDAIKQPHISASSLYIQLNKQAGNACIIAADTARKWATISYLYLNDKPISKKDNLTCRLLIHPVPPTLSLQTIVTHSEFGGKAMIYKHSGENLILEISDKNIFDECIKRGSLRVANKYMLSMEVFSASNNLEGSEIDVDTWYGTEMSELKPDIMQFVANPDHVIFRYKWNAKIWMQQFEKATPERFSLDFTQNPRGQIGTSVDLLRHRLQVTVMLNTLAAIRKKSYFIKDREVKLNLNKSPKTIVYNHQSKLQKGGNMPIKSPPYPKTKVYVVKDDCVAVYGNLIKNGRRPLLLNMASAISPGGGFRNGDGAQEENLFRRSDYFRSLDVGLDNFLPPRSERLRCTSDGRLEPLPEPHTMYPMEEYAAIYTSGLTFFRHSQDIGYEYMDKPMENVCAIAMAAYRDPTLDGKLLAPQFAVGTRKKIENVFSIAYHHKHDSIVLSALGCGAFRNPPIHVAKLFASVIDQYAGFFDTIVFAIVDDHNAGQRLNPEGNYKPFADILEDKIVTPLTPMNKPNTMFGPYRILPDGLSVNDVSVCDLLPCYYGSKCSDLLNSNHTRQYSHPPFCTNAAIKGKCDSTNDVVHMTSFIHRNQCQYGGECREIDDRKHSQEFEHPSYCSDGGSCQNMEEDHLKKFRHLPLCKDAQKCLEFQKHVKQHCESLRHCQPRCPHGNRCVNFHDKKHLRELQHPFPTPCPHTPFHCPFYITFSEASDTRTLSNDIQQHCLDFAHVCRFGRNCMNNTPLHREKSIHIARLLCPYDGKCIKLNQDEHLNSYTHSHIADIRRVCPDADQCCERRKLEHTVRFRHAISHEESGVVRYYGLNKGINFVQNQINSTTRILNYVKNQNWKPLPSDSVPREILDWFRTVQPVHRCNPIIFESILLHGHVMSRDYMEHLKKPKFVANSVMQHSRIRRIGNLHIPHYEQHAREYITAIVTAEFDKANFPPPEPVTGGDSVPASPLRSASACASIIKTKEKVLSSTIPPNDLEALKTKAIEIAQASIKLHSNPAGVGHTPDKAVGTDKRVFSILGPHLGHYYGDVIIVFKREILHHPDADFSMQAATTFISGNAYKWRPWLGPDPGPQEERIKQYHNSKLHASIPGYEYAIALELMAITSNELKLNSMDINLRTIFDRWLRTDSHRTIEGHLPQLIPLDYIDHIYIPKNIFDSLNIEAHKAIEAVFKDSISVTPHKVDANLETTPSFGPSPKTKERADYQNYVIVELLKRYERDVYNPPARPIQGTVITIPPTDFDESFVLPLTISQAFEQYRIEHHQAPPENTAYIYWQVLNGDMMLVLSNETIDSDKDQPNPRCLICYIAPKSESYDSNYFEHTTYINCGQPIQHHAFVNNSQYKAKSNTFHIGCNTDNFITYCLEIHRSSGKVILRQAGSNAIHNHEEISCEFTKKELDVAKLEFIHVTANTKKVSVRNLIVRFEKQMDLHPTFDKDFKKSAPSAAPVASSGGASHHSSSLEPCPDNVNCLLQYASDASGKAHNSKFSHPCGFSELCRNKEPYLTHDPHPSPLCDYDKGCNKLTDPFHRADCRHTDLPDFLVPCRNQGKCLDKSYEHRIRCSHGEQVFGKKGAKATSSNSGHHPTDHRPPCNWGSKCKEIGDADHRAKYSHNKLD